MKESEVRDFISANFSSFKNYITNFSQFEIDLEEEKFVITQGTTNHSKIFISDLVRLVIIDKLKQALSYIENLELIDKEFVLLKTEMGLGRQPAVDLMAYNTLNYCLVLIELKISDSSEREAVTELCAYNQGLQNKYRGLSSLEVLWLPISTEWRTTTKSAIEFEIFWKNMLALPLKMEVDYNQNDRKVQGVHLECFNPINTINEIDCLNIFSYECFEAFDYCTMREISDKKSFINYVTGICSRNNINGFIIFHHPVDLMFPYGFTLCVFNPYKGYLHRRLSADFILQNSESEYYDCLKYSGIINTDFSDIEFKSDKLRYWQFNSKDMDGTSLKSDAFWGKEFLSVGDFGDNAENPNLHFLFETLKIAIDSNGINTRALGRPDFEGLFTSLESSSVEFVSYLGIYQELIAKKIIIEHKRKLHNNDFFTSTASFSYLKQVFKDFNQR
jgi:hypothetical protein